MTEIKYMADYRPVKSFNKTEEGRESLHAIFDELLETEDREIMEWADMGRLLARKSELDNIGGEDYVGWLTAELIYAAQRRNSTFCNANATAWIEGLILGHQ